MVGSIGARTYSEVPPVSIGKDPFMSSDEAASFGRYLLGREIGAASCATYARAAGELGYDEADAVTNFALQRPWSIAPLDGALALVRSDALLRKKLLLMAAVLETQPEYCDDFLPRERCTRDAIAVAASVARAGVLAAFGLLLLPFIR